MGEMRGDDRRMVVINHEEQYSIWPADREVPAGWQVRGKGTGEECLRAIEEVWTDMRPLSVRQKVRQIREELEAANKDSDRPSG